jgi:hypothetical protein
MLTTRADTAPSGPDARPGAVWAEVRPSLRWPAAVPGRGNDTDFTVAGGECPAALASGMAATWDWSKDFSLAWGSEFSRNWSASLSRFKKSSAIKPTAPKSATRAAAVVLDRATLLAEAARISSAANFQNMAFPRAAAAGGKGPSGGGGYKGRKGNCGCESSCGWGDLNTFNVRRWAGGEGEVGRAAVAMACGRDCWPHVAHKALRPTLSPPLLSRSHSTLNPPRPQPHPHPTPQYVYYFDDYCDNGYNFWGPQTGTDMWASS